MKYIVDINRSRSKKFIKNNPNFLNSKDEVGQTAGDKEILEFAKVNSHGVYTQDKRFALDALIADLVVWYRDQATGKKHKLKVQHLKFTKNEEKE